MAAGSDLHGWNIALPIDGPRKLSVHQNLNPGHAFRQMQHGSVGVGMKLECELDFLTFLQDDTLFRRGLEAVLANGDGVLLLRKVGNLQLPTPRGRALWFAVDRNLNVV